MDAALHAGDRDAAYFSEDELAYVANGGGAREVRDFAVGDFCCGFEFVGEGAQAGAEY